MEINSNQNSFADILTDFTGDTVKNIKKTAIIDNANKKIEFVSSMANEISQGIQNNGYQMDSVIPVDSSVSYHV